jgi:nucleotide-binding universal stress UspA family protein
MYTNILVATDGSKLADKAVKTAITLAKAVGAKVTAFYAYPEYTSPAYGEGAFIGQYINKGEFKKRQLEAADAILTEIAGKAKTAGVAFDSLSAEDNAPYEAIIKAATKKKCDLIVMASHGRKGLAGVLLGSETQKVLTHSKVPVLVVR